MANTLTDQFQLVRTSILDTNFIQAVLGKAVVYNDGFCRELFRDGRHMKSLRSASDSYIARKGDTLLSVNMGIVTVNYADKIPTRDGYHISYDATVRLFVLDPRTFATCYIQGNDPLQKTVDVILAALKREVAQGLHDAMAPAYLRKVVENDTGPRKSMQTQLGFIEVTPVLEYGVAILDAQTMSPHADPKRTAEIEETTRVAKEIARLQRDQEIKQAQLQQQKALEQEQLRIKNELGQHQRIIDVRVRDEALEDDQARWLHNRYQLEEGKRRDTALELQLEEARRRAASDAKLLDDLRKNGYTTDTILRQYPELLYLYEKRDLVTGAILNQDELLRLKEATTTTTASSSSTSHGSTEAPNPIYGVTREPREDDIFTISHLGIKVSRHALSAQEAEWAQLPEQSLAYLVETVVGDDSFNQELQQGDLLYQFDDKLVSELAELATYLTTQQKRGNPVRITYLRRSDDGSMYSDVALIDIPMLQG